MDAAAIRNVAVDMRMHEYNNNLPGIYHLLRINLTGLGQQGALNQREALDLQLLLGLGHRLYPGVLLLGLGLGLGNDLTLDHLQVLLLEAACGLVSVAMEHLGAGTGRHFI